MPVGMRQTCMVRCKLKHEIGSLSHPSLEPDHLLGLIKI